LLAAQITQRGMAVTERHVPGVDGLRDTLNVCRFLVGACEATRVGSEIREAPLQAAFEGDDAGAHGEMRERLTAKWRGVVGAGRVGAVCTPTLAHL